MRVAEDQQHAPVAVIVQRNGVALKVGQTEARCGSAGSQAIAFDVAFGERPFSDISQ